MGRTRILRFLGVFWGVLLVAPAAWAAACFVPKEPTAPVAYKSPGVGTNIVFKITRNPESKFAEIKHERYRVKSTDGRSVRWYREPVHGKGPNEDLTMYGTFGRTSGNDWIFKFDHKLLDALWPLKQGNETSYFISARKKTKKNKEVFKLKANYCVRGTKEIELKAGKFQAHLVDFSMDLVSGLKNNPWDKIEINIWYVPEIGFALLMEDRYLKKNQPILIQRREAVEVSKLSSN